MNHFGSPAHGRFNTLRGELRKEGQLIYALIDFDLSLLFPSTCTPAELRLPYNMSWHGGSNQPKDTAQGELDYDPFAFDVGCLGVLFCDAFQVRAVVMIEEDRKI